MEKIREFLKSGDVDILWDGSDLVVWVDWREDDDAVVDYCEGVLKTGKLHTECIEADNPLGYELFIHYSDKREQIQFDPEDVSRDATLIALNRAVNPDYEVRLWMDSIGGDTLAFIPLSGENWSALEDEFGKEKVRYHFAQVTPQSRMFVLSMDEVFKIVEERESAASDSE